MSKYQAVLKNLPSLGADELEEVRRRVMALLKLNPIALSANPQVPDNDVDLVLEAIYEVLRTHGLLVRPDQLKSTAAYQTFAKKVPSVMAYIRHCVTVRSQQRAILRVACELIHRYLAKRGMASGTRLMMANIHQIPDVIEQQFPGYAASGMLGWIAKRESHVRQE